MKEKHSESTLDQQLVESNYSRIVNRKREEKLVDCQRAKFCVYIGQIEWYQMAFRGFSSIRVAHWEMRYGCISPETETWPKKAI